MNNSRSQTKIRKIQDINILAEERYLKNKSLLTEMSDDPDPMKMLSCLKSTFGDISDLPTSCTGSIFPPKSPSFKACLSDLTKKFPDKVDEFKNCSGIKF
jgi:hypothetical protein